DSTAGAAAAAARYYSPVDGAADPVLPPLPPPPPSRGRCMTNAWTPPAAALAWVYAVLAVAWWGLTLVRFPDEGVCARSAAADVAKIVIALTSFPTVLWMSYFGLLRWIDLKSMAC
ncbi:hypothetical protein HK405_015654, partial [Cladochytrium tenue]